MEATEELHVPCLDVGYLGPTLEPGLREELVSEHLVGGSLPMGPGNPVGPPPAGGAV